MQESDAALKLRLELLAEVVDAVGPERFMEAVKAALRVSRGRYDVSVAKVRELAGLPFTVPSPAMQAWALVMRIVKFHLRLDPEGNWQLEQRVFRRCGEVVTEPVPEIPPAVSEAVRTMGGWSSLAQTQPEYWGQRLRDFREIYYDSSRELARA